MAFTIRSLVFTDIEGSTDLLRNAGVRYAEILNEHRRIVRTALRAAGGVEHGTEGDSFFLSFDSPTTAVATAVAIQLGIESMELPDQLRLRVRIGVHVGEVTDNEGDLVGLAVHHAARLAATAHGGQIVVSDAVRAMVQDLPDDVDVVELGVHRVRNAGMVPLFQVVHSALQRTFPSLRGTSATVTNLPVTPTGFVGDEAVLRDVEALLALSPVVTLTGPGGVGKTRLSTECGWSLLSQFAGGVWLVELAPVTDADAVAATVASTLMIRPQPDLSLVDAIVDWLRDRHLLLVLDNCEHLLHAVRHLVAALVARCPTVKVIATSREPLGLAGERVHPVPVMDPGSEGVELFLDRASAADSTFVMTDTDAPVIAEICRRLDGLPLAIELAASRVRSMAPVEMLQRLDDRFTLLSRGTHDRDGRHATVRATVDWSYRLLNRDEQSMFDRLSVCASFDLHTAEAICLGTDAELDVVDLLRSLVDKSMIVAERQSGGTRYRVLETLREFGRHQLEAKGDSDAVRTLHLDHFVVIAEHADDVFRTSQQVEGSAILTREWDNLRRAHAFAVETSNLTSAERVIAATRLFASSLNRVEQGDWVERTLGLGTELRPASPDTYAQAAYWKMMIDDDDVAGVDLVHQGLALVDDLDGPQAALGLSLIGPGDSHLLPDSLDHFERAISTLDVDREWWALIAIEDYASRPDRDPVRKARHTARLVEVAARVRAPTLIAVAETALGHDATMRGDLSTALVHYRSAAAIARECGGTTSEGESLRAIAFAVAAGDPAASGPACLDALIRLYDTRIWYRIWQLFDSVAVHLFATRQDEAAAALVGYLETLPYYVSAEEQLGFREANRQAVRTRAELQPMRKYGAAMNRHQVVEHALAYLQRAH